MLQVATFSVGPSRVFLYLSSSCPAPEDDFHALCQLGSLALWFLVGDLASVRPWLEIEGWEEKDVKTFIPQSLLARLCLLEAEFLSRRSMPQVGWPSTGTTVPWVFRLWMEMASLCWYTLGALPSLVGFFNLSIPFYCNRIIINFSSYIHL